MTMTTTPAPPRQSALPRDVAMRLAATEYQRMASAVADLSADDWDRPTDCPAWNVHQLVAHVVGMATMASSPIQERRQRKAATARLDREGCDFLDALTAHQVDLFKDRSTEELVALTATVGRKAAKGRRRTPGFIRRRRLPIPQTVGGVAEDWTVGYLVDTVLTRDPWMHRIDLSHATGRELTLTAEHDGVIVDDVVAEWADRHRQPYRLTLTGAAGGSWSAGDADDADHITLDAVEFCRILSGRAPADGLLATQVPF
jgi:uncharacterized protein (TIGR03083 family)